MQDYMFEKGKQKQTEISRAPSCERRSFTSLKQRASGQT